MLNMSLMENAFQQAGTCQGRAGATETVQLCAQCSVLQCCMSLCWAKSTKMAPHHDVHHGSMPYALVLPGIQCIISDTDACFQELF